MVTSVSIGIGMGVTFVTNSVDGSGGGVGPSGDGILLETGDYLLLETGDYMLIE